MRTVGLAERLTRYADYVARELNGLTPADATDLRVGPRMCVEAMHEAAALIELYEEALFDIRSCILCPVGPAPTLDEIEVIAQVALAKAHHPEEVLK
jgi:hypothetical protein